MERMPTGGQHGGFAIFAVDQHVGTRSSSPLECGSKIMSGNARSVPKFDQHLEKGTAALLRKSLGKQKFDPYVAPAAGAGIEHFLERRPKLLASGNAGAAPLFGAALGICQSACIAGTRPQKGAIPIGVVYGIGMYRRGH